MGNDTFWVMISSIGTLISALATFTTVLLVLYKDNLKNFVNPIRLKLDSVDDCETFEEVYDQHKSYLNNELYYHEKKRLSTFFYLKIENLTKSRSIKNVSIKYTGYKIIGKNENFNVEIPKYLLFSPIQEKNECKDLNDYLYIGLLRCYFYNDNINNIHIDLCSNTCKSIYQSIPDDGLKSLRLEIEADGLLFKRIYAVTVDWDRKNIDCNSKYPSFIFTINDISESSSRTSYLMNKINKSFEQLN